MEVINFGGQSILVDRLKPWDSIFTGIPEGRLGVHEGCGGNVRVGEEEDGIPVWCDRLMTCGLEDKVPLPGAEIITVAAFKTHVEKGR